jgi:hypothetical protein
MSSKNYNWQKYFFVPVFVGIMCTSIIQLMFNLKIIIEIKDKIGISSGHFKTVSV